MNDEMIKSIVERHVSMLTRNTIDLFDCDYGHINLKLRNGVFIVGGMTYNCAATEEEDGKQYVFDEIRSNDPRLVDKLTEAYKERLESNFKGHAPSMVLFACDDCATDDEHRQECIGKLMRGPEALETGTTALPSIDVWS
jgi:hypothetical protein